MATELSMLPHATGSQSYLAFLLLLKIWRMNENIPFRPFSPHICYRVLPLPRQVMLLFFSPDTDSSGLSCVMVFAHGWGPGPHLPLLPSPFQIPCVGVWWKWVLGSFPRDRAKSFGFKPCEWPKRNGHTWRRCHPVSSKQLPSGNLDPGE